VVPVIAGLLATVFWNQMTGYSDTWAFARGVPAWLRTTTPMLAGKAWVMYSRAGLTVVALRLMMWTVCLSQTSTP
jgi:hypothetical protein